MDTWRHHRLYQTIDPILDADPGATWLTVGDGSWGNDARYLLLKGATATATDISDALLREAHSMNRISDFRRENAESISFQDDSFDYVLCKEAYHHFPRPSVALHEMLRVARNGIVLIEPNDQYVTESLLMLLVRKVIDGTKRLTGKKTARNSFEEVGNYLYSISRREVEKISVALEFPSIAFKGVNDVYYTGVETERMMEHGPLQRKTKFMIGLRNTLCRFRLLDFRILTVTIFKQRPAGSILARLESSGYDVRSLPENPYL